MKESLDDKIPYIIETPQEREGRFGDWVVRYSISKGSFGTVHMVTHADTGTPAAAKQLLVSRHNERLVRQEIKMALRMKELSHSAVASPIDIRYRVVEHLRPMKILERSLYLAYSNIGSLRVGI